MYDHKKYCKEYYKKNKKQVNERNKKYRENNPKKVALQIQKSREKNRENRRRDARRWRKNNPEKVKLDSINQTENKKIWATNMVSQLKFQVIEKYSNNEFRCQCCGENTYDFLTVEHINNDGHEDSKKFRSSRNWYFNLLDNDLYDKITIACWNCNCGRNIRPDKICPHRVK